MKWSIDYDRNTHQYAMYLENELVGFAWSMAEAERTLEALMFELTNGCYFQEAA